MATFRVGQRVRVVRNLDEGPDGIDLTGKEATIASELFECVDGYWWHELHVHGHASSAWARPEELEPIQPEGNRVVEWSECLWQPEHLKEQA